jgi:hypothetical protein
VNLVDEMPSLSKDKVQLAGDTIASLIADVVVMGVAVSEGGHESAALDVQRFG